MELTGLHEPAVSEYLSGLTGSEVDVTFARACHRATGGNPLLLTELARTLQEDEVPFTAASAPRIEEIAPPQVARAIRARLARLDPAAGALARAVSLLGDDAPLDVACELAELDLTVGAQMADALVSAGLLESSGQLCFRHPLLRSAIASGVTPFERSSLHVRAASLLRGRGLLWSGSRCTCWPRRPARIPTVQTRSGPPSIEPSSAGRQKPQSAC